MLGTSTIPLLYSLYRLYLYPTISQHYFYYTSTTLSTTSTLLLPISLAKATVLLSKLQYYYLIYQPIYRLNIPLAIYSAYSIFSLPPYTLYKYTSRSFIAALLAYILSTQQVVLLGCQLQLGQVYYTLKALQVLQEVVGCSYYYIIVPAKEYYKLRRSLRLPPLLNIQYSYYTYSAYKHYLYYLLSIS